MTVALYIRVSTQEQALEGYSIPAQKERLIAFCTSQGITDFKFYIDEGVSAKDMNRPELKRMLEDIEKGKLSMIIVYRLDRFTRRVKDLYTMLETLEKHKCAFRSATELYDTSSAMGRMFIGLVALLAQWETENLSERVKMALEEKVSGGERVGNVPFGFDLNEDEKLVINAEEAVIVKEMIDKIFDGMSANRLAQYLNNKYDVRVWHTQGVLRLLRNPALYGATRWNENVYENTHKGYLGKEEWNKLQQMLADRSVHHFRDVESTYLFQGILACPSCKNPLSVNRFLRKNKKGEEYQVILYRCQRCYKDGKGMVDIGEKRFLDSLNEYMKNVKFTDVKPTKKKDDQRELIEKQLTQIEKKREKFQKAWANDFISDEEFEQRMDETREIYEELKVKMSKIKTPVQTDTEALKQIIFSFNESFFYLSQEDKRRFISQFIRKIEFKLITQPPKRPDKAKKGKDKVEITNIIFY